MQTKVIIGIVILAVLAIAGYFVVSGKKTILEPTVPGGTTQEAPSSSGDDVDEMIVEEDEEEVGVREVTVEGDEFSFSPSSLTVKEGERVRLTFKNVGSFSHNFIIDELGVSTATVPAGSSDTIEFTANQSGTFSFYCSVGNHRAQGMEGEISVTSE